MKKKLLAILLVVALVASLAVGLVACGGKDSDEKIDLIVGGIMVGDETEGYTEAHMNGINAAIAALKAEGKNVQVVWKKSVPEDAACATACQQVIAAGAQLVITNSYAHQFQIGDIVANNPNVQFVAMTGDLAAASQKSNYANAFTKVYQSRYVSGVVAGLKLKELVEAGTVSKTNTPNSYDGNNIKIGYVGAYNYAEVVSGYTAFYLGIKSVVDNVVMKVQYTNSWFDFDAENETAAALITDGCVIIGQHADSEGAPTACEKANKQDHKVVYSVGYNVDMLTAAPNAALTSATNNWSVYYTYLFKQMIAGEPVATNWSEGYETGAVAISKLGNSCAANTATTVDTVINNIKDGTLKVFDCSKFTVGGQNLTTYTDSYGMGGAECIKNDGGVYYFDESTLRSAPYFDIRIDGITEVGAK